LLSVNEEVRIKQYCGCGLRLVSWEGDDWKRWKRI
jgi:hypothetical protein